MSRVAITGRGIVCALGLGVDTFWENLHQGRSGIRELADQGTPPYKFKLGAEAWDYRPQDHFSERELVMLERFAQFAVLAARQAVAESGLSIDSELQERFAVITGTSLGGQFTEEEGYKRLYRENNPRVAPLTIPRTMSNAAASQISLELGTHGAAYTISTACSSSNHAIGQAFHLIRGNGAVAALAGGSEAVFSEGLLRAWEAMRVVSAEPCRPFSIGRKGLTLGEGGAMLLLENWDHARARGAPIFGEVLGFSMSADAHHITQPSLDGPSRTMRWALSDAGLRPEQIGYINAHGTGTIANDAVESEAIRAVFAHRADRIAVSSTKSVHGHTLGAAGAIEALATSLALERQVIPPTANVIEPDPACPIRLVANTPEQTQAQYALSNTFAFGGLNATLVLRAPER